MPEKPINKAESIYSSFLDLCEARIDFAVDETINLLQDSSDPKLIVAYGPMAGGKSTFIKNVSEQLQKQGLPSVIFKLSADTRGDDQEEAWTRNGSMKAIPIDAIQDAYKYIDYLEKGVVALDEVSFLGSSEEIIKFIDYVQSLGISVVSGGLGAWFNGEALDQIETLIKKANIAYCLQSYDSFDPTKPADYTLRGVGISPDGTIVHFDEGTNYYANMTSEERLDIVERLQRLPGHELLYLTHPDGNTEIETCFLVPSHPEDSKFAIGADRYIPVSSEKYKEIYQTAGLNPPAYPSIKDLYNYPNIRCWEDVGLG